MESPFKRCLKCKNCISCKSEKKLDADMEKDENLPRTPFQGIKNFRKNDALFSFKMLKNSKVNLNLRVVLA